MSLRFAILGLLSLSPMSGSELKRTIDESVGHFWTADHPQIYRTLAGLVEDGLATRRTVPQSDRPDQHVHAATAEGLAALEDWLREPPAPAPVRQAFLAKLFFVARLDVDAARELLEARQEQVGAALSRLEALEVDPPADGLAELLRAATRENGLAHARAELEWVRSTLAALAAADTPH